MSLNFFRPDCQYPPLTDETFGLCDPEDGSPAFPVTTTPPEWVATVVNPEHLAITVTAIDNCVMKREEYVGTRRCDVMLTSDMHLYLVELKNQKDGWQSGAIEQLTSTIELLLATHDISKWKKRKAFAANRRHPRFAVVNNELNLSLFRRTGFRIDSQAEIIMVS